MAEDHDCQAGRITESAVDACAAAAADVSHRMEVKFTPAIRSFCARLSTETP